MRTIQRCAQIMLGFIAGSAVIILLYGDREDRPAGLFLCALVILVADAIFTAANSTRVFRSLKPHSSRLSPAA